MAWLAFPQHQHIFCDCIHCTFWSLFSFWKQAHLFKKWSWPSPNGQIVFLSLGLGWEALTGMWLQLVSRQRNGLSIFSDQWTMDAELGNRRMYSVDGDWTDHSLQVCSSVLPEPNSYPPPSLSAHRNYVEVLRSLSTTDETRTYDEYSRRGAICACCFSSSFLGCILAQYLWEVSARLGTAAPHNLESSLISGEVSTLCRDCGLS